MEAGSASVLAEEPQLSKFTPSTTSPIIGEAGEPLEGIRHGAQPVQEVIRVLGQSAQGVGLGGEPGDRVVGPGGGLAEGIGHRGEVPGLGVGGGRADL